MSEGKCMVLLYNHADPDESYVAELTPEQIERCKKADWHGHGFPADLHEECQAARVNMPMFCYYS